MNNRLEEKWQQLVGQENGSSGEQESDQPGISQAESMAAFAAAIGAGMLARKMMQAGWRTTFKREPPKNPASTDVAWKEALLWGAVSGAVIGMMRIASRRGSTQLVRRFQHGSTPNGRWSGGRFSR